MATWYHKTAVSAKIKSLYARYGRLLRREKCWVILSQGTIDEVRVVACSEPRHRHNKNPYLVVQYIRQGIVFTTDIRHKEDHSTPKFFYDDYEEAKELSVLYKMAKTESSTFHEWFKQHATSHN